MLEPGRKARNRRRCSAANKNLQSRSVGIRGLDSIACAVSYKRGYCSAGKDCADNPEVFIRHPLAVLRSQIKPRENQKCDPHENKYDDKQSPKRSHSVAFHSYCVRCSDFRRLALVFLGIHLPFCPRSRCFWYPFRSNRYVHWFPPIFHVRPGPSVRSVFVSTCWGLSRLHQAPTCRSCPMECPACA